MKKFTLLFLFLVGVISCKAQSNFTVSTSGTATIDPIQNISMTNLVNLTSFGSLSDYQNGITNNNYASFAVKSNVPWLVNVAAQSAFFNALTTNASTDMPVSILGMRINGTTNFATITTTGTTLKTGSRGDASSTGNTFNVDLKFSPGFNYKGGQYNINLLYTLTAN